MTWLMNMPTNKAWGASCICSSTAFYLPGTSDPSRHGSLLPQTLLCCATKDALMVWVLEDAYAAAADEQPLPVPLQLCARPGMVEAMALQQGGGLLAVGMDCSVGVWDLEAVEMVYRWDAKYSKA